MVSQMQTTNNILEKKVQSLNDNSINHQVFWPRLRDPEVDSFKNNEKKSQKNKLEVALMGTVAVLTAALGAGHVKLGQIIKTVSEVVPKNPFSRLKKVFELISKDAMTNVFNKASLEIALPLDFKATRTKGENLSVAMLDMDNFKAINEVLSHDTGDIFLKRIAKHIKDVAKSHGGKSFRYGGEEFIVTITGHNSEKAKTIIEEIAKTIKIDDEIQGYLPNFNEKATAHLEFVSNGVSKYKTLLPKLRAGTENTDYRGLADNVIELIENHMTQFKPEDCSVFDEIIKRLKWSSGEQLQRVLQSTEKLSNQSTLGAELNKISTQYNNQMNDLTKWTSHIRTHGNFTISGGVVSTDSSERIRNSAALVQMADTALKSAKENGKNTVVLANDEIINKVLSKFEPKQS